MSTDVNHPGQFSSRVNTQRQAVAAPLREPAPAAFTERLGEIAADLWAIALELANSRLRAEREVLEQARQEAAGLADQVSAELEQAQIQSRSVRSSTAGPFPLILVPCCWVAPTVRLV